MSRPSVAVVYHSGWGHTAVLAESQWAILDSADAIVLGSPTYMGNVSAGFQTFAEATSRRYNQ